MPIRSLDRAERERQFPAWMVQRSEIDAISIAPLLVGFLQRLQNSGREMSIRERYRVD